MRSPGYWTKNDTANDHSRSESADLRLRLVLAISRRREALVDREPFWYPIGRHFLGGGVGVHTPMDQSADFPESDDGRPSGHARGIVVPAADGASREPRTAPRRIGVWFPARRGQGRKSDDRRPPGRAGH